MTRFFTPIGVEAHRYGGTFDGKGHRIKHMKLNGAEKEQGLFHLCHGGTYIKNLIIDASCSYSGTGEKCQAALIGCTNSSNTDAEKNTVTIENVGNEMSFEVAAENNGALLARDYSHQYGSSVNNEMIKLQVIIRNCYNTGSITIANESSGRDNGAFTGWTPNVSVVNSWNTGRIYNTEGYNGSTSLARGNNPSLNNCFDLNTDNSNRPNSGVPEGYELAWVGNGTLCTKMWGEGNHFWTAWGFCSVCNEYHSDFMEPVNGCYEIGTKEQLNWFAYYVNNKDNKINGKLTKDIDFTSQSTMIGEPGHPYGGEFNGQGHTITVAYSFLNDAGGNDNTEFENNSELALFRRVNGGIIKNLKVDGTINTINKLAGGIVSSIWEKGTIENCVSSVVITDEKNNDHDGTHGGILARVKFRNGLVVIRNCAFVGKLNAEHATGNGGIIGWPDNGGDNVKIQNCYVSGTLNMPQNNDNDIIVRSNGVATNCFYLNNSDVKNSRNATGVDNMTALMNGLKPGWWKTSSEPYPRPWVTSNEIIPTSLSSVADVITFASSVACGNNEQDASLAKDIDFDGIDYFSGIGTSTNRYRGTFDGNKYHIKNLIMNRTSESGVGFFSYVTSGGTVIKRFTIDNTCSFSGNAGVGAFVGHAEGKNGNNDLLFEELGNEANVTANGANGGGILGVDMNSDAVITMKNCYNIGIISSNREGGGISGWLGDNAVLTNVYNMGTVNNGDKFARGNNQNNTNCYDNEATYADGTVLKALHNYNANGVDGSVWQMELGDDNTSAHPVLYNAAKVLDEDFQNVFTVDTENSVDVFMTRSVKTSGWNTVCLPFYMDATAISSYFGDNTKVAMLDMDKNLNDDVIHFKSVDAINAGQAYLVYPGEASNAKAIIGVKIEKDTPSDGLTQAGFTFQGVFNPTELTAYPDRIVSGGNTIVKTNGGTLKGFRAYFKTAAGARATSFVIDDDETTGIITPEGEVIVDGPVYNLGGQRVNKPQRGLYIVNGKKVVIK